MDQATLHAIEARCTQEAMPRCTARCPLRMDVRAFMVHMANNNFREARKVLERHLPLPEIMARICDHPCEEECLRKDLGGSLAIGSLETVCISNTSRQGKSFYRQPKSSAIAILGNSLAGLIVASELVKKAYPVTIYHEDTVSEALLQRFPQLTAEIVDQECDVLVKSGCSFVQESLEPTLLSNIQDKFAGVFIDADAAEAIVLSLAGQPDELTGLLADHVCAGGALETSPTGARYISSSRQAGDARRAAITLDRLVSGVSITAERESTLASTTLLYTSLQGIAAQEAIVPQEDTYTTDEAVAEATRCIRCECLACVKECVYLQKYGSYPRSYARQIYNNASIVKGEHLANALINGCMLCGQCTEICPERFSMAELCLMARQDMVRREYMPPSAHEFALEDMASANGASCRLFMGDPDQKTCTYVFFPGCQLAASRKEQVAASYAFLREIVPKEAGVGLFLGCCGVPAHWAGHEEMFTASLARIRTAWEELGRATLVMACASCCKTFREAAPDIPVTSLWEVLDAHYEQTKPLPLLASYSIHDPCGARHDPAWQQAVRSLARRFGIEVREPAMAGEKTACCGYGGLLWCAQPDLAEKATGHVAQSLSQAALASCIMCRDRLVSSGKECLHLLDILPFSQGLFCSSGAPEHIAPPGLSARRANRAMLRNEMVQQYGGEAVQRAEYQVLIRDELLANLERVHILRDDVEQAVAAIEQSKERFLERQSGHYIGAWRPRNVTFWVRYSLEAAGGYCLHDAWCHRMIVPGAGVQEGDL